MSIVFLSKKLDDIGGHNWSRACDTHTRNGSRSFYFGQGTVVEDIRQLVSILTNLWKTHTDAGNWHAESLCSRASYGSTNLNGVNTLLWKIPSKIFTVGWDTNQRPADGRDDMPGSQICPVAEDCITISVEDCNLID